MLGVKLEICVLRSLSCCVCLDSLRHGQFSGGELTGCKAAAISYRAAPKKGGHLQIVWVLPSYEQSLCMFCKGPFSVFSVLFKRENKWSASVKKEGVTLVKNYLRDAKDPLALLLGYLNCVNLQLIAAWRKKTKRNRRRSEKVVLIICSSSLLILDFCPCLMMLAIGSLSGIN